MVKQYFEIITNEKHQGASVLIRIKHTETGIASWENWGATVFMIASDEQVVVEFAGGAMQKLDREVVKLMF